MFEEIEAIKKQGLYRSLKTFEVAGARVFDGQRRYLNFSSNDYLGIASRRDFQREFLEECLRRGDFLMGSTSSRLLVGSSKAFEEAEAEISAAFGRPCLFFNSGYHANTGIIPALCDSRDLILADKLVHASLIDCLKLSGAKWLRFAHNDMAHLKLCLKKTARISAASLLPQRAFSAWTETLRPLKSLSKSRTDSAPICTSTRLTDSAFSAKAGLACAGSAALSPASILSCARSARRLQARARLSYAPNPRGKCLSTARAR